MTGRDTHPDPGSFIGPYRIVSLVGRGGASVVMEVAGPEPGRLALKLIRWTDGPDVAGRRRFLHEARAMRAVHRPHLVPLLEVGEWQGRPYLVMPLVPRGSLRDLLARDGRLSVASSVRLATDVAGRPARCTGPASSIATSRPPPCC